PSCRDLHVVDTSRPYRAITLHADGHGVPGDKLDTYRTLQRDLPEGIFMAWKNFYDEDTPMFTPQQTVDVEIGRASWRERAQITQLTKHSKKQSQANTLEERD